jgi:NAD(P)-dependent dehydrogenase (short-subunit alcohol dehydrogenase family)
MKKHLILTGVNGDIGKVICKYLTRDNWTVIGIDMQKKNYSDARHYIQIEFKRFAENQKYRKLKIKRLNFILKQKIFAIINNAAKQLLIPAKKIKINNLDESLKINCYAPFLLFQEFSKNLEINEGFVINIGTIHNKLTLPNFLAYAVSKSAFSSILKSLSIELGEKITFLNINPGAIDTKMLKIGLSKKNYQKLKKINPSRRVGRPEDIAELITAVLGLTNKKYLNGSSININGGISNLLSN